MAKNPEGFTSALWVNVSIVVVSFGAVAVFWKCCPVASHPRAYRYQRHLISTISDPVSAVLSAVYHLPDPTVFPWLLEAAQSPLGYALAVLKYSRARVLTSAGLDALALLAVSEIGIWFFLGVTLLDIALILPINYLDIGGDSAGGIIPKRDPTGAISIDRWSFANMSPGSLGLWAHACMVWVTSAYLAWLMLRVLHWCVSVRSVPPIHASTSIPRSHLCRYAPMRYQFLANDAQIARRTVLVRDIPRHLCSERDFAYLAREMYSASDVVATCLVTPAVPLQVSISKAHPFT